MVTALATLDAFTISMITSNVGYSAGTAYPAYSQTNDYTATDLLDTEGGFIGGLHSLCVYNKVLTQLELYHDEYTQKYFVWRGRAYGAFHRLITEDVCIFAEFLDYSTFPWTDYSQDVVGVPTLVTGGGSTGSLFAAATSNVGISRFSGFGMY